MLRKLRLKEKMVFSFKKTCNKGQNFSDTEDR